MSDQGPAEGSDLPEVPKPKAEDALQAKEEDAHPQAADNGNAESEKQQEEPAPKVELSEFERELQKAKANPTDFNQWVAVEKLLEKEGNIEKTREVYDGFLAEYPLCYAYWKKYAEWEHKHSTPEWAISVYKRGTAAIPYSCDLWGHFATYKQRLSAPAEEIREVFEDGAAYVGSDYLAHILWDKYLKFESQSGSAAHITRLYLQILGSPLRDLDRYYASFKAFAQSRQLTDLMDEEEQAKTQEFLCQAKLQEAARKAAAGAEVKPEDQPDAKPSANGGGDAVAAVADGGEAIDAAMADGREAMDIDSNQEGARLEAPDQRANEDANPDSKNGENGSVVGSIEGGVKAEGGTQPANGTAVKKEDHREDPEVSDDEIKAYWLSGITALYQETKVELTRRRAFEDLIKRPYFHVKPLPAVQLEAWDAYLDYILTKEDAGTIVRLFERCLVACATYPEFWKRYIRYLSQADAANAKIAMQRAQQVHCKRDASLHLFAAKFHERTGDFEAARDTYKLLLSHLTPDLVEAIVQAASFERRMSNMTAACAAFDTALEREEGKDGGSDVGPMIAMFYANFLFLDCNQPEKARALYKRVLKHWHNLRFLWEAALHFEEHCLEEGRVGRVMQLYTDALASSGKREALELSLEDRQVLSERLKDFADRHCTPDQAYKIEGKHEALFSKYKMEAASRKRAADSQVGGPSAKKAAVEPAQPSAAGAAAGTANPYQPDPTAAASGQQGAQPAALGPAAPAPAYPGFHDPNAAAYASQPMVSGAPAPNYYPQASNAYSAYGYGYQYPQQYGYGYAGYQ